MKNMLLAVFVAFLGIALSIPDAEARRLGGSRSFGMQRSAPAPTQAAKPAPSPTAPATAPAAAPPKPGMGRFLGPLAGLAAGLGIAALLSHFGLGEAAASILMLALLVFAAVFVLRLLLRKPPVPGSGVQYAGAMPGQAAPMRYDAAGVGAGGTANSSPAAHIPADFDAEGFLRQAKLNFIRLQAANDRGDMADIRQFVSPELYGEIEMQFRERAGKMQETDVQKLDAEVLEVVTEGDSHVVSVRFHGTLREDGGAPEAFTEIWHLTKPVDGSRGWTIAGIQQVQ